MSAPEKALSAFMDDVRGRSPGQEEFHQAVEEVAESVLPWVLDHEEVRRARILERLTEPDRIVSFRVEWMTDEGECRMNRAWRVQWSRALGPYKGGLRFHPSVDEGVLKFLGFEQTFKNALTGLYMGGAKGGADFDPKGRSEAEVRRFCQSMMVELRRHIGEAVDVPAGDIGVGSRELGWLFGHYMRLENRFEGVLTGKAPILWGSALRKEATGYGCVDFCERMLERHDDGLEGKRIAISGSGNVALYAAEKAIACGAKVVTMSDSDGFLHTEAGLSEEQLESIRVHKEERRGRLSEFAEQDAKLSYHADQKPWGVPCEIAMPCATQNELDGDAAAKLVENGVRAICEGANMPTTAEAVDRFRRSGCLFAPGKAANAGGVAVSGLEQRQNLTRESWSREEVDRQLRAIMETIHDQCVDHGEGDGPVVDYVKGANRAGFERVAEAMLAWGST